MDRLEIDVSLDSALMKNKNKSLGNTNDNTRRCGSRFDESQQHPVKKDVVIEDPVSSKKMLDYCESFTLQENTFFGMEVKFGGSHEGGKYCLSTDKMYWFRSPMNDVCSEYLFNSLSLET